MAMSQLFTLLSVCFVVLLSIGIASAGNLTCMSGAAGAYYSQSGCDVCQKSVLSMGSGGPYAYCASSCTEGTSAISTSVSITTYCCKSDLCNAAVERHHGDTVIRHMLVVMGAMALIAPLLVRG